MATVFGTDNPDIIGLFFDEVTSGADTIFAFAGDDIVFGRGGNDTIFGGAGADAINGGSGTDTAAYGDSAVGVNVFLTTGTGLNGTAQGDTLTSIENLSGSAHVDLLVGNDGNNRLSGGNGSDTLQGGGGVDTLNGDAGNDALKGGGGADILVGGLGVDTADYFDSAAGVAISLVTDAAGGGDAQGDQLDSIENVNGTAFGDTLIGDDIVNVLDGRAGDDVLKGFAAADTLRGGDGDDHMDGGFGIDVMIGGLGDDSYVVDNAADVVTEFGGEGIDVVSASTHWTMTAGADIETLQTTEATGMAAINLTGNATVNRIIGNDGHNVLNGDVGADEMIGRDGDDTYFVDSLYESVSEMGGQGQDEVRTSTTWTLTAGADVETLRTTNDAGLLDIDLTGNASGNVVRGNNGHNILNGGDGDDELTGLGGADLFVFDTPLSAAFNVDVITDFDVAADTILLDDDVFSSSLGIGNISAGEFVIGATALDANDRIIYNDATGSLLYDSDGNGGTAAVQFAQLSTGLALTNLDFVVVA